MRYSFSRIESYLSCPYKFKLRYIDKLDTLPDYDAADNPLTVGTAMHHAIEVGPEKAIREYIDSYPIDTDDIETEAIKVEIMSRKVRAMIDTDAIFEFEMFAEGFIGYIDYLDLKNGILLDFKYSNNEKHYMKSPQIHVYAYLLKKYYGVTLKRIGYLFIPKLPKPPADFESLELKRKWIREQLETLNPYKAYVTYDENMAEKFLKNIDKIDAAAEYPKKTNRLCWFCDYRDYCQSNGKEDYMILPKNERREIGAAAHRKIWIYGAPFSGKTTLADKFPDALMLNTDGNINYVSSPYIHIANKVEVDGHITRTTMAWDVFREAIAELEKKQNTFKSIVVDLVEDLYEACRLYMYGKLGISHESDNSFKAWDMVRTEFLSTMKRLMNLDYDNIILISHEDTSKDITKRNGDAITAIKPNIPDKVANKLAGMVDIVIRCLVIEGNHMLSFKSDEVVFGGGRMDIKSDEIPNDYDALISVYKTAGATSSDKVVEAPVSSPVLSEAPSETEEVKEEAPKRRRKKTAAKVEEESTPVEEKEEEVPAEEVIPMPEEKVEEATPQEEAPRRRRRRRE